MTTSVQKEKFFKIRLWSAEDGHPFDPEASSSPFVNPHVD